MNNSAELELKHVRPAANPVGWVFPLEKHNSTSVGKQTPEAAA